MTLRQWHQALLPVKAGDSDSASTDAGTNLVATVDTDADVGDDGGTEAVQPPPPPPPTTPAVLLWQTLNSQPASVGRIIDALTDGIGTEPASAAAKAAAAASAAADGAGAEESNADGHAHWAELEETVAAAAASLALEQRLALACHALRFALAWRGRQAVGRWARAVPVLRRSEQVRDRKLVRRVVCS